MQVFNRHVSARGLTVFGFETALISGSMLIAAQMHGSLDNAVSGLWRIVLITVLCELCFYYNDLYDLTLVHSKTELVVRILQAAGAAAIVFAGVSVFLPSLFVGHDILVALCLLVVAVPLWRLAFNGVTQDPYLEDHVLILGTGSTARTVAGQIRAQHDYPYRIVGFVDDPDARTDRVVDAGEVLGSPAELADMIARHRVNRIIVSLSDRRGKLPFRELLQAKMAGVQVEDAATTYERLTGKILVEDLKPSWLIFSEGFCASRVTRVLKRALDLSLAAFGLVVGAPLMLLTALAVRLESPGPVLYRQERVGENGRVFVLSKFRSMRTDAESGTPIWAGQNDARVTRIGRFIRKTRLDELPQLWNVLRGDMSFVGPRPERPFFVEQLAAAIPFYMERHSVKPGVTGWAQVKYRYGASIEDSMEKLRYDLYYIKHQSIVFDLTIVMDTVKVIILGKGRPVKAAADDDQVLIAAPDDEAFTVARNVSTRYLAILVEAVLGLLILPFNVAHLGTAAYGLWMLTASVTTYFSVLDLGYSGALVKFVAQYRARRDGRALNEVLSTLFYLFTIFGATMYLAAIIVAVFLGSFFQLTPDQVHTGRLVLLIITVNVAMGTAFSVFGGVINGFQRYDLNNIVGTISSIATAAANVIALWLGYGLVGLVLATTSVRVLTYAVYRANAYRVFPGLRIRTSLFRRSRLREVTFFSVYMLLIDWANKLNYSVDAIVIGIFLNTTAVAVWTVGERLAEITQRLTNQLNDVLFPAIVNNDTTARTDRLQRIFVQGTRLSLATVMPLGGALVLMAGPLVHAWVGPEFAGSVIVVQLLSIVVIVRVGNATGSTLLKGAGRHRLLAFTNVVTALANLGLSLAFVKWLGLAGVAVGTMLPITAASMLVIFPAACRRVGIPVRRALAEAVWPAVWPVAVMALYVVATRPMVPASLLAVGTEIAIAALVYGVTFFFFSISADERHFYLSKAGQLTARWRLAASEGA